MNCHVNNKSVSEGYSLHNSKCYDGHYYPSIPSSALYNSFTNAGLSQFCINCGLANMDYTKIIFPSINLVDR